MCITAGAAFERFECRSFRAGTGSRERAVWGLGLNPNLNPKRADSRTQGEGAGEYLGAERQILAECRRCVLARVGLDACLRSVGEEARWHLVEASRSAFLAAWVSTTTLKPA